MSARPRTTLQTLYDDRPEALAEMLYRAYNDHGEHPWQTWDCRPVPAWEALPPAIREKWAAAARCVLRVS